MPVGMWVIRMAESVLFTFWPPAPELRNVSMRTSAGLTLISMSSSTSGYTKTEAKEVCLRALESKGEMRTRRCTPTSALRNPKAWSPRAMKDTLLRPASSPGWKSPASTSQPFRSA